jgi:hypothetical protein
MDASICTVASGKAKIKRHLELDRNHQVRHYSSNDLKESEALFANTTYVHLSSESVQK